MIVRVAVFAAVGWFGHQVSGSKDIQREPVQETDILPQSAKTIYIDELSLDGMDIGAMHFSPTPRSSVANTAAKPVPLKIGDRKFERGVGAHAPSLATYEIVGEAVSFEASVGVDAWVVGQSINGSDEDAKVRFRVVADEKVVAESPVMISSTPAYHLKADLRGAKIVRLEIDDVGTPSWDLVAWGDAKFTVGEDAKIIAWTGLDNQLGILTPKTSPKPRINGARIFGVRPGREILWRLAVTGERPMELLAENLPMGVKFDVKTGRLSGSVVERGTYEIKFYAKNAAGSASSVLKLVVGDQLALTPPMGWNSWNVFGSFVTEKDIRAAADAMVATGLADHGWSYVNIDDFWQNSVAKTDEKTLKGPLRAGDGTVVSNMKFPDMKGLADYIHAKGLKAGLYSSPSDRTCGGCEGTFGHEWQDAATYAKWGYDYLKYDGCSYLKLARGKGIGRDMRPFITMAEALRMQDRDIVFSINPYGGGSEIVLSSGGAVAAGANSCRTTGDINDSWQKVKWIIDDQRHRWPIARPGSWNDPDMLVVGVIGGPWKFRRMTKLTHNMQYTHMSLWCMLASPLLIGCDLTKLDDFTLALLSNDEVIDVSQDELGAQAELIDEKQFRQIWAKPMSDGSYALALFNPIRKPVNIDVELREIGLAGTWRVRDLWRQCDVASGAKRITCEVPPLATTLVRLYPEQGAGKLKGLSDIRMLGYR